MRVATTQQTACHNGVAELKLPSERTYKLRADRLTSKSHARGAAAAVVQRRAGTHAGACCAGPVPTLATIPYIAPRRRFVATS
eukprot:6206211-Pleurochrysis_carterae.AAC.6